MSNVKFMSCRGYTRKEPFANGIWTPKAENWNGRVAMLGFTGIVLTEALAGKSVLQVSQMLLACLIKQVCRCVIYAVCLPASVECVLSDNFCLLCSSMDLPRALTQLVFPRYAGERMQILSAVLSWYI